MALTVNNSITISVLTNLSRISSQLAVSNARLSSGLRVNRAADDPSGIVAVASFDQQIAQIDAMTANGQRINSMVDTADGAMSQIASLLGTIQSKAVAAAGSSVTAAERGQYQAEIDAAINSIDTLVNTTTFGDTRLLDGGLKYTTSGIDSTELADVRVNSANSSLTPISLEVEVSAAAEKAVISYSGGDLVDDVTFSLTGNNGTVEFTVASGSTKADIETAVNLQSDATGIDADLDGGVLYFRSADYGSAQTASIDVTAGTFALDGGTTSDTGVDATVTVNDQTATADGLQIYFSSGNTSVRFSLQEAFGTVGGGSSTFSITGGGADWQLDANPINQIHFGMSSLNTSYLGNDTLGYIRSIKSGGANALSSGNYQAAGNIATAASQQVATDRARLGAVQTYTVNSTLSAFASTKTALSSARSSIMDLDYAAETANNDRLQALMNIGMSVLATLSQNTNSILTLLRT